MTRTEFLNELEQNLNQSLDQNQIYAVLHSFADIYNHGERQGKREFEISNEIGKPKELANQIIAMWACDTLKKSPSLKNLFSAFGSLYRMSIWGPVLGFPALLFSLLLSLCVLLVVGFLSICSLAGIFSSFLSFSYVDGVLALCFLFISIFFLGVSLLLFSLFVYMVGQLFRWAGGRFQRIYARQGKKLPKIKL